MKASMMIRMSVLTAACFLTTAAASAQDKGASPAVGAKVGVINVRQAIIATAEGKLASAELQSQFASRQTELENLNKQINDIRQRLQTSSVLSPEEQQRLQAQGQRLSTQLERKQNEYQEDLNSAQQEVIDKIGRKMMDVLDRYCRENGYLAVLNSAPENSPILYFSPTIDVTQEIIRLYDQAYPVKGSVTSPAATKPAAPKPATPPPAQQKPPGQ